jgi:hypothetical protein
MAMQALSIDVRHRSDIVFYSVGIINVIPSSDLIIHLQT